jgi:hypothetical protein
MFRPVTTDEQAHGVETRPIQSKTSRWEGMSLEIIATVLAIIAAPVIAVWVGQKLQNRRIEYDRRYWVFSTLMRERFSFVTPNAVAALNLIDLEFKRDQKVLHSWHGFYNLVTSTDFPKMDPSKQLTESRRCRSQLLLDMASAMNFREHFSLEDFERGYVPIGIADPQLSGKAILDAIKTGVEQHGGIPVAVQLPRWQRKGKEGPTTA